MTTGTVNVAEWRS